ncbi:MAG: ester cyclase [Erythrobacter sp.]|uniref:nuclear transport factor 2 family protein n=1 Tax=Erythrobacter sp. TaxID=1042 RepID=UPI003C73B24C
MRIFLTSIALGAMAASGSSTANAQPTAEQAAETTLERNKRLAAEFYENLWFTDNTDAYADYVAETYIVHDLGDRKGVSEPAMAQKSIADFFHSFGQLSGEIDYQIAEGDKVATRWFISLVPDEAGRERGMTEVDGVAIINVFRFDDSGKIVEIWNHRHDVELPQPSREDEPQAED